MNTKRHPFLDDLDEQVILMSSVLQREVDGRETALRIVKAAASRYRSQTPTYLEERGDRRVFEYDFELLDGVRGRGLVSMTLGADQRIVRLHIAFSPLGAVLSLAASLSELLKGPLDAQLFL